MPIVAITSLDLPAALAPLKTIDHSGDLTDPIEKGGAVMGPTSKKGASKVDRKTLTKLARNWQAPPISLDAPMHNIQIPVSIGELVDKLTSLEIKLEQLQGEARQNVEGELDLLQEVLVASGLAIDPELWQQLAAINRSLWRIEDEIRELERLGSFGDAFIALARSVYRSNDRRAQLKRLINQQHGSLIVEEKGYAPY